MFPLATWDADGGRISGIGERLAKKIAEIGIALFERGRLIPSCDRGTTETSEFRFFRSHD
jgi:hypothetical protein